MFVKQIFDDNPNPCWIFDLETLLFIAVNRSFTEVYGYAEQEAVGKMLITDIRPDTDVSVLVEERRNIDVNAEYRGTWRHQDKTGCVFYVDVYAHYVMYNGRKARFVMAVNVDERIRAEQANRALSYKLKKQKVWKSQLLSALKEAVWSIRAADCTLAYINKASQYLFGYQPSEIVGSNKITESIHPADRNTVRRAIARMYEEGYAYFECRMHHRDGSLRHIFHKCTIRRNSKGLVKRIDGISLDVTDLREAEKAVADTNAKSDELFNGITDAFFSLDFNWNFTYVNKICEQLYRKKRIDVLGESIWEVFPHSVNSLFHTELYKAMEKRTVVEFEEFSPTPGIWISAKAYPVREGLAVYFRDITEQKKLRELLQQEECNRKAMVDNVKDAIWAVDQHIKLLSFNQAYAAVIEKMFGYTPFAGCNAVEPNYDLEVNARWLSYYNRALGGEQFNAVEKSCLDGAYYSIDLNFMPIIGTNGEVTGVSCVARDVTDELKKVSRIEHQNRRLKEIAWLQSHKMRAPVASMLGLVQLINKDELGSEENRLLLEYIEEALGNMDAIIHEINDHTRQGNAA